MRKIMRSPSRRDDAPQVLRARPVGVRPAVLHVEVAEFDLSRRAGVEGSDVGFCPGVRAFRLRRGLGAAANAAFMAKQIAVAIGKTNRVPAVHARTADLPPRLDD